MVLETEILKVLHGIGKESEVDKRPGDFMTGEGITLGICTSTDESYRYYIDACEELRVRYKIIDFLSHDWIEQVQRSQCDGFLLRPPCDYQERKTIYDERMYLLNFEMNRPIYPGYKELYIYENKRNMADWLKLNGFPQVKTRVFTDKRTAMAYFNQCSYPVVFKSNVGSGSKQVLVINSKLHAKAIATKVFGLFHPAMAVGYSPLAYYRKKSFPFRTVGNAQKHYLLVQDYKEIKWEWRIIRIGNSFFGHKKLLKGKFASGSGRVGWEEPPTELLGLARDLSQKGGFHSMALDVFETVDNQFCINEIQSIFGSYDDSQMYINGRPGRYVYMDGNFIFEEGRFNRHGSYLLRVEHFLEILSKE